MIIDNDLLSIQHARIIAENGSEAYKKLASFSQEKLDDIVDHVAEAVAQHIPELAVLACEETDSGNWQDKAAKNRFVCELLPAQLKKMRCVGIIDEDAETCTMDVGVPLGVIVALCPVTSPVSTTISKTLLAIKSGNAVLFSPHPGAANSMGRVLDIMIEAAQAAGLPEGCIAYLDPISKTGSLELMKHPATALILATGVPGMLDAARATGKPLIYGGTGNGPAFIERTADVRQAVKDIVASKVFDNGLAPSAEQSIVVDACIAEEVRAALREHNGYFLSKGELQQLARTLFCSKGILRKGMVGQPVQVLAKRAGLSIPADTTILIAERKYVSEDDPFARELLCPVLAFYVEADWMDACEKCIELLLHERNAHSLVIHSQDKEVIRQFALKKPVGRLLVNTPASFGGMGATTNLFPSMTLGSSSAGRGITSDNVSPMNLIYIRKVGYGVQKSDGFLGQTTDNCASKAPDPDALALNETAKAEAIQKILTEAIKALSDPADR
ncbi:aldehyde dehydrogenase family protein [Desulfosediminicola ganghwensis]|uniref:aldehyde dehydrogenase family protein n=1 Tax=Desulfosediminicola ganghwensis TaxID=2569540 RepID=UPI0010AD3AC3|nr:aldehyde dehydrogenase family protein [Desulfosediminicola ganghwensis]